jgi:hypothetical protein
LSDPIQPTSDEWASYRNYADSVRVSIVPIEHPMYEDDAPESWVIESHGAAWDQDWLVREVYGISRASALPEREMAGEHVLKVQETHFSWGADAAAYEILLLIAQWAATSLAWDAAKGLAGRMQKRLRGREEDAGEAVPLTEEDAEFHVRHAINSRYSEPIDHLELVSLELTGSSVATVVLRATSGWTYECDLEVIGRDVAITRIKRSRENQ